MKEYNHSKIEKKWQKEWEKKKIYKTSDTSKKNKMYVLDMFPYPSGEGLHVGHPRGYIATDVYSRMKAMQGYNVLHPMGWDAFGLPAENFAIKNKIHPSVAVEKNVKRFKEQLSLIGPNYDWSREINTTNPGYYKWTQWIFLQMYKKGLAYESYEPINWCPGCLTGLANEDVENDGTCERCGSVVEQKPMRQWVLKITDYADRMLRDLDKLPKWPEGVKEAQRNWIGRSEGALIKFASEKDSIEVFTTRPDTIFGATFIALAGGKDRFTGRYVTNPASREKIPIWEAEYVMSDYGTGAIMGVPAHDERDFEFAKKHNLPIRQAVMPILTDPKNLPRTGKTDTKRNVVHVILRDVKNKKVLLEYLKDNSWGTNKPVNFIIGGIEEGESEREAAKREIKEETGYTNIEFKEHLMIDSSARFFQAQKDVNREVHVRTLVFDLLDEEQVEISEEEKQHHDVKWIPEAEVLGKITILDDILAWKYYQAGGFAHTGEGILINSGEFDGMATEEARSKIIKKVRGKSVTKYKLRDWIFSRQRYWGEPIPIIHCPKCRIVPVREEDLPVKLPEVKNYEPSGTGESPLANIKSWVNTKCPKCKGPAKRETNTMPQWAGSSWYYLRYIDPYNKKALVDKRKEKKWMSVDVYVGGDHATRHLIYARFWHKFLYDIGTVSGEEPFPRLEFLGFILAEDGRKMSKRWKNVINPDDMVERFGADAFRLYEMFIGPFENAVPWSTDGMVGTRRFIERVWRLSSKMMGEEESSGALAILHKTIKKVTEDIESFKFNTAVSALMILLNALDKEEKISKNSFKLFLQILAPFAPHMTEELWHELGEKKSIHISSWPTADPKLLVEDNMKIVVQVNGKLRGEVVVEGNISEDEIKQLALNDDKVKRILDGKAPKKIIYVKGRLINIVF